MIPIPDAFVKTRTDAPPGFFEAEAAGLRWLAEAEPAGGARIARVLAVEAGRIELERIAPDRASAAKARAFGASLAVTHSAGASAFGAAPWDGAGPLFIGRREQPVAASATWGSFYAADRVLPFLDDAQSAGFLTDRDAADTRAACRVIADGAFDDGDDPARLHGDLWSGNVLWDAEGVVLIDPAAHGGHRETDLAMLDLFGCPFLDDIVSGYEAVTPLRAGWRERVPLHQLHPLAVHAAGHGPSYGSALGHAARRVLALAD